MLKLLVLGLLASLAQLAQSDDSKCVKGPSYWCQSIQNAKECNAFAHCLQTVWTKQNSYLLKKQLALSINPTKCTMCVECLYSDLRRCAVIRSFKDEITEMMSYNLPNESICKIMDQCQDTDFLAKPTAPSVKPIHNMEMDEDANIDQGDHEHPFDNRFACGLHPRNWCNSLDTARRCNAFEDCLHSWSISSVKYRPKELDSELISKLSEHELTSQKTCGYCVFVFGKLQSIMQENTTEINVKEYLDSACSMLPTKQQVDKCQSTIQKYLPEIFKIVRTNVDPGVVCRLLKMCNESYLQPYEKKQSAPFTLDQVKVKVLNEKDAVIKVQEQQPQQPQQSQQEQKENKPILPILQVTNVESKIELVSKLSATNGVGCELCQIVLTASKYLLENKVTYDKILDFVEVNLCGRLGTLNETCVNYIKLEGDLILSLLAKSFDPALICRSMGLCMRTQVSDETNEKKFFDLDVRNELNCTLCKMVVGQVKRRLTENRTQAEIVDYIKTNLCQKIGRSKELCKSLIDTYGPLFLEIIAKDVQPTQVCVMIGMCSRQQNQQQHPSRQEQLFMDMVSDNKEISNNEVSGKIDADATCILCEFAVNLLKKYITENATEPEIEKWLNYVCDNAMPASLRNECNTFVTAYGPIIANLLSANFEPEKVCKLIGVCTKHVLAIPLTKAQTIEKHQQILFGAEEKLINERPKQTGADVQTNSQSEIPCAVCQFAIQYINSQLAIDTTEKTVEFTLNNVCKLTPNSYKAHCNSLVETHGIKLLHFINKYTEPLNVCHSIKICPTNSELLADEEHEKSEKQLEKLVDLTPAKPIEKPGLKLFENDNKVNKNNTLECTLCIYVAELADNYLKQNKTETEILAELGLVCNLFPTSLKDQCNAFINEYGPYVIQLIAADLDPETTCSALKLCEKSADKKRFYSYLIRYNIRP